MENSYNFKDQDNYIQYCFVQGNCDKQDHTTIRHSKLAPELTPCESDVEKEFVSCLESNDIDEVIFFFEWCVHNNIHIIGSRNYAYKSDGILILLKCLKDSKYINPTLFTRTLGFRDFCVRYIENKSLSIIKEVI